MSSSLKVISFLGAGAYERATYRHPAEPGTCETEFVQEAVACFYQPDTFYVLLTEKAASTNWPRLNDRLAGLTQVVPVSVPDGRTPEEIWTIFERLTDCLTDEDEVIFDITHAFRSLPVLSLIAVMYLRVVHHVRILGLVYGAWEARDEATGEAPIFDLLPLVSLLDWTTATDKFLKSGDSREMAALLTDIHTSRYRDGGEDDDRPQQLRPLAESLSRLSEALALARPVEVGDTAARAAKLLHDAEPEARRWAQPFAVLLDKIRCAYSALAPLDAKDARQALAAQWRLIEWYLDRGQVVQAAMLAREWVVSVVGWRLRHRWQERDARDAIERSLGAWAQECMRRPYNPQEPPPDELRAEIPFAGDLWNRLGKVRNQIAHCGMGAENMPSRSIFRCVQKLRKRLRDLAHAFGLDTEGAA